MGRRLIPRCRLLPYTFILVSRRTLISSSPFFQALSISGSRPPSFPRSVVHEIILLVAATNLHATSTTSWTSTLVVVVSSSLVLGVDNNLHNAYLFVFYRFKTETTTPRTTGQSSTLPHVVVKPKETTTTRRFFFSLVVDHLSCCHHYHTSSIHFGC